MGKVHYFWGGKSNAQGWDPDWGQPKEVVSAGSETSGTIRPYGLDCSGFVAWCYIQLGLSPQEVEEQVGYGTWNQWDLSLIHIWQSALLHGQRGALVKGQGSKGQQHHDNDDSKGIQDMPDRRTGQAQKNHPLVTIFDKTMAYKRNNPHF